MAQGCVMLDQLVCWKCGESIASLPMPLARQAQCASCGTQLHVCRQCRFYDRSLSNQCKEPVAEYVQEKTKANFCGYFQIKPNAFQQQDSSAAEDAKTQLESLFGVEMNHSVTGDTAEQAKQDLENLFGIDKDKK